MLCQMWSMCKNTVGSTLHEKRGALLPSAGERCSCPPRPTVARGVLAAALRRGRKAKVSAPGREKLPCPRRRWRHRPTRKSQRPATSERSRQAAGCKASVQKPVALLARRGTGGVRNEKCSAICISTPKALGTCSGPGQPALVPRGRGVAGHP